MGVFSRIRVAYRSFREELKKNETDNICAELQALGIDAQMAERGRPEEEIEGGGSLGLIDIPEGPIHWVNVRKQRDRLSESVSYTYHIDYGVSDPRLGLASPEMYICSVRKKDFPLVGRVVDFYWEGDDSGLGIIERLKSDAVIKYAIMVSLDVKIRAHWDHGCWIISTETSVPPSEELWDCYQAIAQHLLAKWPDQEAKWYCVECGGGIRKSDRACATCGVEL